MISLEPQSRNIKAHDPRPCERHGARFIEMITLRATLSSYYFIFPGGLYFLLLCPIFLKGCPSEALTFPEGAQSGWLLRLASDVNEGWRRVLPSAREAAKALWRSCVVWVIILCIILNCQIFLPFFCPTYAFLWHCISIV